LESLEILFQRLFQVDAHLKNLKTPFEFGWIFHADPLLNVV
jgi:hypothetical protein